MATDMEVISSAEKAVLALTKEIQDLRTSLTQEYSAHGRTVDELAFWKYQALWHRAALQQAAAFTGFRIRAISDSQMDEAERDLERARIEENRERYAHAEGPREIGS